MIIYYESELYHYGVPGMKWGRRKARPAVSVRATGHRVAGKVFDANARAYKKMGNGSLSSINMTNRNRQMRLANQAQQKAARNTPEAKAARREKAKKAAKVGAAAATAALAVYGAQKFSPGTKAYYNAQYVASHFGRGTKSYNNARYTASRISASARRALNWRKF